jgi:FMN phosphatase YigB (HAD superfamily)
LISSLDKYGYEARFFSDISLTHLARTHELFSGADYVPDGMYSFVSGAQKPAEEMFAAFEEKFGVPALYVDDRAELIEAAQRRNWNAIRFTNAEALQAALK